MSHQGNIFLSYNLALIVKISNDFPGRKEGKLKERISKEILTHLLKRFNKEDLSEKEQLIRSYHKDHIKIEWLKKDDLNYSSRITTRNPKEIGKIYIFLFLGDPQKQSTEYDDIEPELQKADTEMRLEFFHVELPENKTRDDDISGALKHLASRICTAFVEYSPEFKKGDTCKNDNKIGIKPIETLKDKSEVLEKEKVIKKILDIRDAVDLVCEGLDGSMQYFPPVSKHMQSIFEGIANDDEAVWVRYKFPFGVWFRGQAKACYDLTPTLFRSKQPDRIHGGCEKPYQTPVIYDESSMVYNFMLTKPEFRKDYQELFEWLCLMQHYDAPSRVMDWTENILMALYFAVQDRSVDCDGVVWALNAGRLNEITRASLSRRYACFPNSVDVILRSAMAISRTNQEMKTTLLKQKNFEVVRQVIEDKIFFKWLDGKRTGKDSETWRQLAYPVAVYPGRNNLRQINQQAAFTIHGGKSYDPEIEIPPDNKLPDSESLIDLSRKINNEELKGKPFLEAYLVPSCAKRKLREQLKRIGVHVATAFPELEYQAQYIKNQWLFDPETLAKSYTGTKTNKWYSGFWK